jgi:hypothetical protein
MLPLVRMGFLRPRFRHPSSVVLALVLAACGGSGGDAAGGAVGGGAGQVTPPYTISNSELVTDQRLIGIPNAGTYPAKGNSVTDPVTKFKVMRVADKGELRGDYAGAQSGLSAIVYSRFSPTNTTGEFALVHGENSTSAWIYRVADSTMVTILRFKPSLGQASNSMGEVNELRWDYSGQHPYRLYFVGRNITGSLNGESTWMSFYQVDFDPTTGQHSTPTLIRDFSAEFPSVAQGAIMNDVEGDSSSDSRYWAWQVMETASGNFRTYAIFTYDKTTNVIIGRLKRSCTATPTPCATINTPATAAPYISRPNMVEMSPLGTRVIVDFGRAYSGNFDADVGTVADGPKAFLPNFSDAANPVRIGADATHSGWAWGLGGEELFVSQNNRNDWIEAVDIRSAATAKCSVISGNSYSCGTKLISQTDLDGGSYTIGYHFGRIYDRTKRGWVYMNTYDSSSNAWGKNQNLLVQVNDATVAPSKVVRLGSTYNAYFDYRSEGSGALDFKAENIWTTGNWGFTDGRGDVIRVQLPSNLFSLLPSP